MKISNKAINLSPRELKIIESYREKPNMQPAIDKILEIENEEYGIMQGFHGFEIWTKTEIERFRNLPETDEDF